MFRLKEDRTRLLPARGSKLTSGQCGLADAKLSGWFHAGTGELLEGFPITAADTVLDVGCGDGAASVFAARCGAEVISTDVDDAKIERVRRKLAAIPARAFRCLVSNTCPLPLPDASATRIVAMEVLEHVDDPRQFMEELVRVGKPEAKFLLAVPDPVAESIQQVVAAPAYWQRPNHIRIFARDEFERLVADAGLTIEHRLRYGFFWSMWWILFWGCDQEFGEPDAPLLQSWTDTWQALLANPKAAHIRKALNDFMPKSQVLIARKAA